MIASNIGKIFLKYFNKRKGTDLSAKQFFEEKMFPLFFDNEKYMQWVINSPFVQGLTQDDKGKWGIELDSLKFFSKDKKDEKFKNLELLNTKYFKEYGKERISLKTDKSKREFKIILLNDNKQRNSRLEDLKDKIEVKNKIDASTAIGYPPEDDLATTSGQLTDLDLPLQNEDFYASWIGGGLGVGVQGRISIYFDQPDILWKIYEGWSHYRSLLEEYDKLRGNQIESWNGKWLAHVNSEDYLPGSTFAPLEAVTSGKYKGMMEIPTARWTDIMIAMARGSTDHSILNAYVFKLGQMNTTVGFIPFNLPEIKKPVQFYIDIFGKSDYLDNSRNINSLYGTAFGFLTACQMGVIGVRAMEPKDMKKYLGDRRGKVKAPNFSKSDEEQLVSFKTYQTWLLAMLDNKQLWEKADQAAKTFLKYEQEAKNLSTKNIRQIEEILDSSSKRKFIEGNIAIIGESNQEALKGVSDLVELINLMPEDNFRYFRTLIKFRYKFHQSQNN